MTGERTPRFSGARALVTGGGSGIGEATCRLLSAEGAEVTVLDHNAESASRVAFDIGGRAIAADVADSEAMNRAVADAAAVMGGLSILVNNAGVGMAKPLVDYIDKDWSLLIGPGPSMPSDPRPRSSSTAAVAPSSTTHRSPVYAPPAVRARTRRPRPRSST